MGKLPATVLRRPSLAAGCLASSTSHTAAAAARAHLPHPSSPSAQSGAGQVRHATFVPRSRRPYQFTQLVQLSDGSTFTVRTTSPAALYRSGKDSRNHMLWQPTEKSLRNVEVDEAGKLAAFRERYGKAWDLEGFKEDGGPAKAAAAKTAAGDAPAAAATATAETKTTDARAAEPAQEEDPFGSLVDLISEYATEDKNIKGGLSAKDQARKEKSAKKK
ncbi:hypothetical protein BT67DRAFT_437878 [Trichocladium antarcticum]|uniref:Ribosomal protein bL31m N-terminal domain-containing protein n=1 Tax=Trichocladium antarcticum TaxID=1450529 RepID=A0AAN6ZHY0_9PEZI|nr:hypothetical protein BT67DRAFT_437878 [Trichocladium antarcticum]